MFYVTEIVLSLGFADAIFRRERSDDRKCVCCSQANLSHPSDHIYPFPLSFMSLFQEAKLTCNTSGSDSPLHPGKGQAPVVQTLVSAIYRINLYLADSVIDFRNTYPLDSYLSGG